jgi:hypothetical protein
MRASTQDAGLAKYRHHRTPLRECRLEQVQPYEQREPEDGRMDLHPLYYARRHDAAANHPQRMFNGHNATLFNVFTMSPLSASRP